MKAFGIAAACLAAAVSVSIPAAEAQQRPMRGNQNAAQPQQQAVPQPRQEQQFPVGVSFIGVSLGGRTFSGERPALTLDQTYRLKGFAGCNNYSATAYPLREQGLAVGPFALTKRNCDKGRMDLERAFLVALRSAQKWEMQGSSLVIKSPNGDLRLERSL